MDDTGVAAARQVHDAMRRGDKEEAASPRVAGRAQRRPKIARRKVISWEYGRSGYVMTVEDTQIVQEILGS